MATTIGKYIHRALSDNASLTEAVGGRIYPVTCPDYDNTPAPFIVYATESLSEAYTKDGRAYDTAQVSITVVARDYDEKMELLPLVRKAMEDGFPQWNAQTEPEFILDDQTMTMGADEFDLEFGYHCTTFSYTIEME